MKLKKVLETRIDINNINDIYCSDYDKKILQILKDKYINKCFKSIYILDVLQIIKRSGLQCKNKVLDGHMYVDISFEVYGVLYEKGDIIHNCKIIQINANGAMHAKSEYASLHIKNPEGIVIFKEMDEIPVIVNIARYNIFDTEISASTIPLIPILKKSTIFKIVDNKNLGPDEYKDLLDLKELHDLEAKLSSSSKSNKSIFKFFRELLYPYKTPKKINFGTTDKISFDNLILLKPDDLVYKLNSYLDDNTYLKLNLSDKSKIETLYNDTSIIEIEKSDYIIHLLNEYGKNIEHLLEFINLYDTTAKIKAKSQVWALYNTLKK